MNVLKQLYSQPQKLFHIGDLANLWGMQNSNSVKVKAKRMVDRGDLKRIYRGFYAIGDYDDFQLGSAAYNGFCYLSLETILYQEGYISQSPSAYTFIADSSKRLKINEHNFRYRKIKEIYLHNNHGIIQKDGFFQASPIRAIADILYYNPFKYFDREVDFDQVRAMQKMIGYPLTKRQ